MVEEDAAVVPSTKLAFTIPKGNSPKNTKTSSRGVPPTIQYTPCISMTGGSVPGTGSSEAAPLVLSANSATRAPKKITVPSYLAAAAARAAANGQTNSINPNLVLPPQPQPTLFLPPRHDLPSSNVRIPAYMRAAMASQTRQSCINPNVSILLGATGGAGMLRRHHFNSRAKKKLSMSLNSEEKEMQKIIHAKLRNTLKDSGMFIGSDELDYQELKQICNAGSIALHSKSAYYTKLEKALNFSDMVLLLTPKARGIVAEVEGNSDEDEDDDVDPAVNSLYLFSLDNPVRRVCISISTSALFDPIITLVIFVNCIFMAMDDSPTASHAQVLAIAEMVFTVVFAIEMCLKIIAQGFYFHKLAYLRDAWNWLDFVVVICSPLVYINGIETGAVRLFRVARPLRAIKRVPGMRIIISSILASMAYLRDIILLLMFLILVLGIVGVQLYGGKFNYRCVDTSTGAIPNMASFCSGPGDTGRTCPSTPGLNLHCMHTTHVPITSFDNLLSAALTIFQCVTLEGWTDVMYAAEDVGGAVVARIYFLLMILFGSFFVVKLITAVVFLRFDQMKRLEEAKRIARADNSSRQVSSALRGSPAGSGSVTPIMPTSKIRNHKASMASTKNGRSVSSKPGRLSRMGSSRRGSALRPPRLSRMGSSRRGSALHGGRDRGSAMGPAPNRRGSAMPAPIEDDEDDEDVEDVEGDEGDEGDNAKKNSVFQVTRFQPGGMMAGKRIAQQFVKEERQRKKNEVRRQSSFVGDRNRRQSVGGAPEIEIMEGFRGKIAVVTSSLYFQHFITCAIMANAFFLAIDHYGIGQELSDAATTCNDVLYAIFMGEIVIKLLGMGVRQYVDDPFNLFDFLVVAVTTIEKLVVSATFPGLSVLRCFRLLRVLKLLRFSNSLRALLKVVIMSIHDLFYFFLVFALFVFVFAVLGMQLYRGNMEAVDGSLPRMHFENLGWAVVTVFQVVTAENWNLIMYDGIRGTGYTAALYFITLFICGNYVIISLFMAIMLGNFDQLDRIKYEEGALEELSEKSLKKILHNGLEWFARTVMRMNLKPRNKRTHTGLNMHALKALRLSITVKANGEKQTSRHTYTEPPPEPPAALRGKSCALFGTKHRLRILATRVVAHKLFDRIVLGSIVLSNILLVFDDPQKDASMEQFLFISNVVLTGVFTFEVLLKMLSVGIYIEENSYFRSGWNILDFFVVFSSLLDVGMGLGGNGNDDLQVVSSLRIFRALRALRALRAVSYLEKLKVVIQSLVATMGSLGGVAIVAGLFFCIFAILGVQLFKGVMFNCVVVATKAVVYGMNQPDCLAVNGHEWQLSTINFNDFGQSFLVLFQIASLEMWPEIMLQVVDAAGEGLGPVRDSQPLAAVYFICFILVGNFFVVGLFVGVLVDQYNTQHAKFTGSLDLNDNQRHYLQAYKDMLYRPPPKVLQPISRPMLGGCLGRGETALRKLCFIISCSKALDLGIMVFILLNTLAMGLEMSDMDPTYATVLTAINDVCSYVFILEMVLKLVGLGYKQYLSDQWNTFDCFVVNVTIINMILDAFEFTAVSVTQSFIVFRVMRTLRIFRLVKQAKGIRQLLQTLLFSLPMLANVFMILMMLLFMYAIMGMTLFGRHADDWTPGFYINEHANFNTFLMAFLTLFRMSTGEAWNGIMHEVADDTCKGDRLCVWYVGVYFFSFTVFSMYLMMNVFVAVVLKNFEEEVNRDPTTSSNPISRALILKFGEVWNEMSDEYYMPVSKLRELMLRLPAPLGPYKPQLRPGPFLGLLHRLQIPQYKERVHWLDVCLALTSLVMFQETVWLDPGIEHTNEMYLGIKYQVFKNYPELKKTKFFTQSAAHVAAALAMQRRWRERKSSTAPVVASTAHSGRTPTEPPDRVWVETIA